ncbi:hypothetical protein [Sphingorhabdus sp.]|uniref:hypothetical protein n=1 Tax=Sphingorhabdus sp. TaxID=1902408 RepID=UPI003BAEC298|nr:hypothetical protein [Sphingomonadales bacterium]MBL0023235.1 hypothetical protein [Sphingomonadales bacterium]
MTLDRIIALAVLTTTVVEGAWCAALLCGFVNPSGNIDDVLHDTYYITVSVKYFLAVVPLILVGLGIVLWISNKGETAGRFQRIAAWAALSGATIMFAVINWLAMKTLIFPKMPLRFGEQQMDQLVTVAQRGHLALAFGASLVVVAAILLIAGALVAGRQKIEI